VEPKASHAPRQRDLSGSAPLDAPARLTIATNVVLCVTIIATGLQMIYPEVLSALRRDPDALAAGEWWRMVTPLFVHADGWVQIIANLIGIAVVGPLVERLFGSWRWLALYFITGVVAEAISYAWEPFGAGASIALCGLIGGLLVWLFKYNQPVRTWASLYVVYLIAGLVGYAIGGFTLNVILSVLFGSLFGFLLRRPGPDQALARAVVIVGLVGAGMLTIMRDNHGPALLVGAGIAALMLNHRWR
jgi:rhomboid protease GluP